MAGDLTPEELIRDYLEPIYRFAALLCPAPADRDDLAQDALVRAIRRRHQYDPAKGDHRAWLWRIVINVARDQKRAAGRASALWERLLARTDNSAVGDSAESLALQYIESEELLIAIHQLPTRHRTMIALRFGAGLRHREIAETMGISEGAATQALRRALQAMRRTLEEADQRAERPFLKEVRG